VSIIPKTIVFDIDETLVYPSIEKGDKRKIVHVIYIGSTKMGLFLKLFCNVK
jgi:hypothetical protein